MLRRSVLALVILVASATALAAQEQAPPPATVSSMGEAVIRRPPDRAIITLTTESRGQTPQEAQTKGAAFMQAVQSAVDALKLTGGQVMTTGLYLSQDYEFTGNQRIARGFLDRHTIVIRLDDISRAGEVLSVAVGAGATNISGIRFERSDREALEEDALKQAARIARARADAMAAGVGRTVDRVLRIAEERVAFEPGTPNTMYRAAQAESVVVGGSVPVASGEVEIRMRVVLSASIR
jgi:hypothetical protein